MYNQAEFKKLIQQTQKNNKKTEFLFLVLGIVSALFGFILTLTENSNVFEKTIGYLLIVVFGLGFISLAIFGLLTNKKQPEEEAIYKIAENKPDSIKLIQIEPIQFKQYINDTEFRTSYKINFYQNVDDNSELRRVQILIFDNQVECQNLLNICYKIFNQAKYEQLNPQEMISGGSSY